MGTIEERLGALECQFRRSQRLNRALALAMVAMVGIAGAQQSATPDSKPDSSEADRQSGANQPDDGVAAVKGRLRTVEADQFVLLDRLGRSRATMVVTDEGPAISMFDENGRKRLVLSQAAAASGLELFDEDESPVASLTVPHDATRACLEIRSPQGRSLTRAAGLVVEDGAHRGRLQLALVNGNYPVLGISQSGQQGPASVEVTASDDGGRGVKIHDVAGRPLFSVTAAKEGATHLSMRHPDHERSLEITASGENADGPLVSFFAPARKDGTGGILARLQCGLRRDLQPFIRIVDSDGKAIFYAPAE